MGLGIECPACGGKHSEVQKVAPRQMNFQGKQWTVTRRTRICRHCGFSYSTVETHEDVKHIGVPDRMYVPGPEVLAPKRKPPLKKAKIGPEVLEPKGTTSDNPYL